LMRMQFDHRTGYIAACFWSRFNSNTVRSLSPFRARKILRIRELSGELPYHDPDLIANGVPGLALSFVSKDATPGPIRSDGAELHQHPPGLISKIVSSTDSSSSSW
jgi:hypothetical protein